jgi:hypothetical protein
MDIITMVAGVWVEEVLVIHPIVEAGVTAWVAAVSWETCWLVA